MNKKSQFPRQNVTGNKVLGLDSCDHSNRSSEKNVKEKKNLEKNDQRLWKFTHAVN